MANEPIETGKTLLAKQMDEGQVTTAGAAVVTVTDAGKNLVANQYAGYGIKIVSGTGVGSVRRIVSHTALGVFTCDAVLTTDLDSKYIVFEFPTTDAAGNPQVDVLSSALPTGAATEVTAAAILVDTGTIAGDTTSIDGKTPALGQALMAASTPVAIASNQSAVPISAASLPLPTGAATEVTLALISATGEQINIGGTLRTITRVAFDVSATTTTVVAAVADQKIYIVGIEFCVDTDSTTFKLTENTVGDLHAAQTFMKGGGKVVGAEHKAVQYKTTTVNKALDITTVGGKATGSLWYCQF